MANQAEEIALMAIRRWCSSDRRGLKQSDVNGRNRDLAKVLVAHFEPEPVQFDPLCPCVAEALGAN
jgi:hypothetical protein